MTTPTNPWTDKYPRPSILKTLLNQKKIKPMEVTIIDYKERENTDGEKFFMLVVESDITLVQSQKTGNYYATSKKASMSTTFDEETIKRLVGKKLDGSVERLECEPYEFTMEDTGEVVTLSHRYQFIPAGQKVETNQPVSEQLVH